jgi:prepilin-type processing-associated H-X9-DG protein
LIAARHKGKGDVVFADSHVEPETPQFGKDPANSKPTY